MLGASEGKMTSRLIRYCVYPMPMIVRCWPHTLKYDYLLVWVRDGILAKGVSITEYFFT